MWFVFQPISRPVNYDEREVEDVEYEDLSNEIDNEPYYV